MADIEARDAGRVRIRESELLRVEQERVVERDFSKLKLTKFTAVEASFVRCRFERMRIKDGSFGSGRGMSEYLDCSFDGSHIKAPAPGRARFARCSFQGVRLRDWTCRAAEFIDCVFAGEGRDLIFTGSVAPDAASELGRSVNEFRGNDFSEMTLRDVAFRGGIDLTDQVLPSGDDYLLVLHAAQAIARVRDEVRFWDDGRREEALAFLRYLSTEIEMGQEQLFLRLDDYKGPYEERNLRELFGLLSA